ncbi:MAG: DNA polymerase III subunit [Candidatus Omnitrophica bacterium]|nr:DNA polymerase III subunit [Candidatus Omnitrophota bacterium]
MTKTQLLKENAGSSARIGLESGRSFLFVGSNAGVICDEILALVKRVNCLDEEGNSKSDGYCDTCKNCRMIEKKQHPDVLWLAPSIDTASIKIEDIRHLKEKVYLKPYQAQKKIFVIENAQRLTPQAANAMLKILEEPPPDALLILTCENASQLLPTVVSRCRLVRITQDKAGPETAVDDLKKIAARFFEKSDVFSSNRLIDELCLLERREVETVLGELLFMLRDGLFLKLNARDCVLMSPDFKTDLERWVKFYCASDIQMLLEKVMRVKDFVRGNANIKIAVDSIIKDMESARCG